MGQELILFVLITNGATLLLLATVWFFNHRWDAVQTPTMIALCLAAGIWCWLLLIKREALSAETIRTLAALQGAVALSVPFLWLLFVTASVAHRGIIAARRWQAMILLATPFLILAVLFSTETVLSAGVRLWLTLPLLLLGGILLARTLWPMFKERRLPTMMGLAAATAPVLANGTSLGATTFAFSVPELTPLLCGASVLVLWLISFPRRPQSYSRTTAFWSPGRTRAAVPPSRPELPAILSHELRNLVGSIVSASDILARTRLDPHQRSLLEIVSTSSNTLLKVANATLELSALESARTIPRHDAFSLRNCIEETFDIVAIEALHKRLQFGYVIADSVPDRLIGDRTRLGQILLNLVANSVKFTERGGIFIDVQGRPLADNRLALRLAIADSGPGIPAEHLPSLFQPFSRPSRPQPGSGLGLAISRQFAMLLGGDLTLEQTSNHGTTFAVTVQVLADPAAPPASLQPHAGLRGKQLLIIGADSPCRTMLAASAGQWGMQVRTAAAFDASDDQSAAGTTVDAILVISDETLASAPLQSTRSSLNQAIPIGLVTWLDDHGAINRSCTVPFQDLIAQPVHHQDLHTMLLHLVGAAGQDAPSAATSPHTTPIDPKQILLVDDDTLIRFVTRQMLESFGHQVAEAATCEAAVQAVRSCRYDMIFLDMHLADGHGSEVARKIRRAAAEHQPYIIAFTGEERSAPADEHRKAGINAWLVKPLTGAALTAALAGYGAWRARIAGPSPRDHVARIERLYQAPPSAGEPLDDFLRQFGLDGSNARLFIDRYLDDSERLVREMRMSFEHGQATRIARAAHQLKSSSALFNDQHLTRLCQQLDTLARSSAPDDYAHHIALIEAEYQRVRTRLSAPDQPESS